MNSKKIGITISIVFVLLFTTGLIVTIKNDKKKETRDEKVLKVVDSVKKIIINRNYSGLYKCKDGAFLLEITSEDEVNYIKDFLKEGIENELKKDKNSNNKEIAEVQTSGIDLMPYYKFDFYDDTSALIFNYTQSNSINDLYIKEDIDKVYKGKIPSYPISVDSKKLKLIYDNLVSIDACAGKIIKLLENGQVTQDGKLVIDE